MFHVCGFDCSERYLRRTEPLFARYIWCQFLYLELGCELRYHAVNFGLPMGGSQTGTLESFNAKRDAQLSEDWQVACFCLKGPTFSLPYSSFVAASWSSSCLQNLGQNKTHFPEKNKKKKHFFMTAMGRAPRTVWLSDKK